MTILDKILIGSNLINLGYHFITWGKVGISAERKLEIRYHTKHHKGSLKGCEQCSIPPLTGSRLEQAYSQGQY